MHSAAPTILILDNDLGFSFWLGQALTAPNCNALPATTVKEALALITEFRLKIDFLIMNPAVPGATDFKKALRKSQGQLRVATLDSEISDPPKGFDGIQTVLTRKGA